MFLSTFNWTILKRVEIAFIILYKIHITKGKKPWKRQQVSEILIFFHLKIWSKVEIFVGGVMQGLTGLTGLFVCINMSFAFWYRVVVTLLFWPLLSSNSSSSYWNVLALVQLFSIEICGFVFLPCNYLIWIMILI